MTIYISNERRMTFITLEDNCYESKERLEILSWLMSDGIIWLGTMKQILLLWTLLSWKYEAILTRR